jgi:uncharacterized protein (TIGR02598 family)
LIEVVLAIGIVGFAMLVVLALLPNGIKAVRGAETLQATSNIANQLRGQLQLLSFNNTSGTDTMAQLAATNYYYTTDGLPTAAPGFYKASFSVTGNVVGGLSTNVVDASFSTNNAVSVLVTLTYPPGSLNQTNVFSLFVARQTDN